MTECSPALEESAKDGFPTASRRPAPSVGNARRTCRTMPIIVGVFPATSGRPPVAAFG
jgi:hypothetical protein